MDEQKMRKEIETNVFKYCPYRFDDPETKIKDSCGLFDCHCVAIDSLYTHIKNKKSLCQTYNDVVPSRKSGKTIVEKKRCSRCNKLFSPTGNRQKFCSTCSIIIKRDTNRKWMQNKKMKLDN